MAGGCLGRTGIQAGAGSEEKSRNLFRTQGREACAGVIRSFGTLARQGRRTQSPLFPPVLRSSRTSRITMALSAALHMS